MQQFRNLKDSFLFKIFAALIALSFTFFGVSNFLLAPSDQWVAKINDIKITQNQLIKESNKYKNIISRQLDKEQFDLYVNSSQFQQDILNNILNKEFDKLIARYFNFNADADLTLNSILDDNQFANDEGNFDRNYFNNFLQFNSINEQEYIEELNNITASNIISQALTNSAPINEKIATNQEKSRNQERNVNLLIIDEKNINKKIKVAEDEIKQYFEDNIQNFTNEERRIISYLTIDKDKITQKIAITNNQAEQYYQDNINNYKTLQSRDLFQVKFDNEDLAKDFLKQFETNIIKGNKKEAFIKYAKKLLNRDEKSITLNNITQDQLIPELIDHIFTLNINDHSKIIKTPLGHHIILLNKINPSKQQKFGKVKQDIIKKLQKKQVEQAIQQKLASIEEDMILNNSIENTAKKFQLSYSKNPINIDISGKDIQNKIPNIIKNNKNFLTTSFTIDQDQFSQIIESNDQKYYHILKIDKIIPAHQKKLSEVKKEITKIITQNKIFDQLSILSQEIHDSLVNKTKNFTKIAKKYSAKIIKNKILNRKDSTLGELNKEIFKLNINDISSPIMVKDNKFYIALLTKISEKKIDKSKISGILENDKYRFKSEIMQQFNKYLSEKYAVKLNQNYKP